MPPIFFNFWRPHFATPIRDLILRLTFATHVRDSHVHDYTSDSHSRLAFVTTLATPVRDSRSRPQPRLALFYRDLRRATPPLTDGLCSHPSVISLAFQP